MTSEASSEKNHTKGWVKYFRYCITVFLIIFLLNSIGLDDLLLVAKSINLLPLVGVTLCVFVLIVIGAINIWLFLKILTPVSFYNVLKVYVYSWSMSLITPGQAGDATIILLMKKYRIPFSSTGSAYFFDKIITLCLFSAISVYGCAYFLPDYKVNYRLFFQIAAVFLIVVLPVLFLAFSKLKIFPRIVKFIGDVQRNLVIIKNSYRIAVANVVLTIFKWIVVSLSFWLAFLSVGVIVKWPDIGVIPIMSTLVGYIPISIGGIGTVELSATYLFGLQGVTANIVVTAYILMRLINYLTALGVIVLLDPFKAK